MPKPRIASVAVAAAVAVVSSLAPLTAQSILDPRLELELWVEGLFLPTGMTFIGDNEALVIQKTDGWVRHVIDGVLQPEPVLDVSVNSLSERGLLGITRDPAFVQNQFIYLLYTEIEGDVDAFIDPLGNRLYRYRWTGSALVEPQLILDLPTFPGPNHNGGVIRFGPDDRLYVVTGDLNRNGKLVNFPEGADPDDTGVLFRIDRAGNGAPDNPFYDRGNSDNPLNRYYAYGIRNSFGFDFDPLTGYVWDTENGPGSFDEVNRLEPGANSGWEAIQGPASLTPGALNNLWLPPNSYYADPQFSWAVPVSPTGIAFARSPRLGCEYQKQVYVADANCGNIYRFELTDDRLSLSLSDGLLDDKVADNIGQRCSEELERVTVGVNFGTTTGLEVGPDGWLYVVGFSGKIHRIGPKAGAFEDQDSDGVDDRCDCDLNDPGTFAAPGELSQIRLSGVEATRLSWDSQAAAAGETTRYRVISGSISNLRMFGDFTDACTLTRNSATDFTATTRVLPPSGDGYYFLVRGENDCGQGSFGYSSQPMESRMLLDAAPPPFCVQ